VLVTKFFAKVHKKIIQFAKKQKKSLFFWGWYKICTSIYRILNNCIKKCIFAKNKNMMFRKSISVSLVVLFLAYGGGIGFSLHNCEHCRKVKIYFFVHPDCCPAAEIEHHHGKLAINNNDEHCCTDDNNKQCPTQSSPEAYTAHCKQCCVSEFVYFKINADYRYNEQFQLDNYSNNITAFDLLWNMEKLSQITTINNKKPLKEKPPLLAGGESFLVFSHQLLFYA
jgi:hypothetical protein